MGRGTEVIAQSNALYRLEIAKRHLTVAEKMLKAEEWPTCVSNAQLAIENAAKAILASAPYLEPMIRPKTLKRS